MAVTPALTPTTMPDALTVAVCELPVVQATAPLTSLFLPSGAVAIAVMWMELVRGTAQGAGVTSTADTVDDDVEVPHATARRKDAVMRIFMSRR